MENNTKKDGLKNFLEAVGKNIKEERKKAKMTQHDLAVIARIDLNTISNIENNKSPNSSFMYFIFLDLHSSSSSLYSSSTFLQTSPILSQSKPTNDALCWIFSALVRAGKN